MTFKNPVLKKFKNRYFFRLDAVHSDLKKKVIHDLYLAKDSAKTKNVFLKYRDLQRDFHRNKK